MATIPIWAIVAFFVVDTIVMAGVLFYVLSRRNQSGGGANTPPSTFSNPTSSPFESPFSSNSNATDDSDILEALRRGQKIEAIKIYRERYKTGLKEAKDAVEDMERRL